MIADDLFVRVAVRVRPLLAREVLHRHRVCVRVPPGSKQVMLGSDRVFSFDHAFGPESSQDEVYESCIRPLLDQLLGGHNATVFCYGQTGSGKTYTMEGGSLVEEGGIIHRLVHDLFYLLDKSKKEAKQTVRMSYLELYKEELRDLLELPTVHKTLHIREDDKGNTVVTGATETPITSAEELLSVLETSNALRQTSATAMNDQSSRSHTILSLHLCQNIHDDNTDHQAMRYSKLCLVDLAGSERAYKTGNTGQRLQESACINTGLLALGNVIRALTDPNRNRSNAHIPYRDSKMTRLLRDSLGGHAQTLMIACVSPSDKSVAETMGVLRFASKARRIVNQPVSEASSNVTATIPWDPGEAKTGELEFEVQMLRGMLKEREYELRKEREGTKVEGTLKDRVKPATSTQAMGEYLELAEEAAALLAEVSPAIADSHFERRVKQWHEKCHVVKKLHGTAEEKTTEKQEEGSSDEGAKLREELSQCKEALATNEEILCQKELDLNLLKDKIEKLNQECKAHLQQLETEQEQNRIKTEQLVDLQLVIEHLQGFKSTVLGTRESSGRGSFEMRAHSVTLPQQSCALRPLRKIHSSPPSFSLKRVMASFKMRGQLLLAELDEKQKVYCPFMEQHDKPDTNTEEEEAEEESLMSTMGSGHSLNRTWTNRQRRVPVGGSGLTHESDELIQWCPDPNGLQCDQQTKSCQSNKMWSSVTQRRIKELTVNMKMKEELIKELERTDKLSKAVDRQGSRSADGSEARAMARISKHNKRVRTEVYSSLQHMKQQKAALQTIHNEEIQTAPPHQRAVQSSANRHVCAEDPIEKNSDKDWLEELEEQVLHTRAELRDLDEEQWSREEVQQRRQACLQKKNKLEVKRLRSSQVLSQDLLRMSVQLEDLEEQIHSEGKAKGVSIEELKLERDALQKKHDTMEAQLKNNRGLTPKEKHDLLQLEEALETFDVAVELKSKSIQEKQKLLSSQKGIAIDPAPISIVTSKLKELSPPEMSELFTRYFNKVVCLRESERSLRWRCEELHLQSAEQDKALKEMEGSMQRLLLDTDRRLMQQQREHQANIQLLLRQLKEIASKEEHHEIQDKLHRLEKELYFYKSSSRQLKKQLRELNESQDSAGQRFSPVSGGTPTAYKQQQASTRVQTTHTRINATETPPSQMSSSVLQKPSISSLNTISDKSTSSVTCSFVTQTNESDQRCQFGEALTPVPRGMLRQISPSRLHTNRLIPRGQHFMLESSTETIMLEDSIEVIRNGVK